MSIAALGFSEIVVGSRDYVSRHDTHISRTADIINELNAAMGVAVSLNARLNTFYVKGSALSSNLNGGAFRAANFADAEDAQDLTTLSQVTSLIVGGGNPGDIAITSLNKGSASDGQLIGISGGVVSGVNVTQAIQKAWFLLG